QNMATITKSENSNKTLVDAISEVNEKQINNADIKKVKIVGDITSDASALSAITCTTIDLSEATFTSFTNDNVKYVVLPNGWTKEQVNTTAKTIGKSLESAASALNMIVNMPVRHYYEGETEFTDTSNVKIDSEGNYYYVKTISKDVNVTAVEGYPKTKYAYTYGSKEYEIDDKYITTATDGTATITSFSIPLTQEFILCKQDDTRLESWQITDDKYYWENNEKIEAKQKPIYKYTYNWNPKEYEGDVTQNPDGTFEGVITLDAPQTVKKTTLYRYEYEDFDGKKQYFDQENEYTASTKTIYKNVDTELTHKYINENVNKGVSLTAYVKKPGTLVYSILNMSQLESEYKSYLNVWYVAGEDYKYDYTAKNVKNITLSGNLNAIDLNTGSSIITNEGHLTGWNEGNNKNALPFCTPDTLDLSDAIFGKGDDYHPEDMTIISMLFKNIKSVLLPTDESQTVIPADCFYNMDGLTELMIPSHYEVIGERAFCTSHTLSHIYVKDIKTGTIYDHGDYTITLPESLKEIKSEGVESFDKATFSGNALEKITDVYVMAQNAPKCGKYAFNAAITYGNNGFAGNWAHPIKRDNYINNGKVIAVLHYPTMSRYNGQDKNYTDITRVYTLQDETGMVDGNGKLKVWPRHAEFFRSFEQAKKGHIWTDWKIYANEGATEVIIDNSNGQYTVENPTGYNQKDYQGWHEFVLSETYITKPYDPQEHYDKFDQYDWYTICIPYDITKSMLLSAFGVNKEAQYKNKVKMFGKTDYQDVASVDGVGSDGWLYPDVRSLIQVKRSYKNLMVTLCLSEQLFTPTLCQEITIGTDGQGYKYTEFTGDDPVILKAGMPYLIRPYVPADTNIKNIGAYLCSYVSQVKKVEPKLFKVIEKSEKSYAVPQERGVETQALKLDESTESNRVYVIKDDGKPCKYNFVGTYVDRFIPQYGYYLGKEKGTGKHKFFRTTKTTTKWNRYASIITGMSTPKYVYKGAETEKDIKNIELQFDGITDDLVILKDEQPKNNTNAAKKLGIAFDDTGSDFLPTSIDEIDVEIALPEDNRIYTVNGTRVAADRLQKGIYIKDGKKIVVK
ncbi:MAG: leucine-rich repeat protein, partial [Prevotella sp.]|nr:leucine-rich repeat protein [Prevotella sp.]